VWGVGGREGAAGCVILCVCDVRLFERERVCVLFYIIHPPLKILRFSDKKKPTVSVVRVGFA
jgi:hypothetical protein